MDNRYLAAGAIGGLVIAAVVAAFFFLMPKQAETATNTGDPAYQAALAPKPDDIGIGDPKAPIKFIEYASAGCPHCAAFAIGVMPEIRKNWIDTGKVYYVFRDYPLDGVAATASMIARCQPKDKFYAFMDILFQNQQFWHTNERDPKEALIELSRRAGLSREQVESCLKDQAMLDRITKSREEATTALKVDSTPTMFINGERIVGAANYGEFDAKFKAALPAS